MATESKKEPRFNNGRMYVQVRNRSLVGLRDLPEHLKTGSARAQLTPIFSILLSNIDEAFAAEIKGEVDNYIDRIELKPKFSSSKLDIRTDTNPDSFGYIEDMDILKNLPYEYDALLVDLSERFKSFKKPFIQEAAIQAADDVALLSALGLGNHAKDELKNEVVTLEWLSLDSTGKKTIEGIAKSLTRKLMNEMFGAYHAVEIQFCDNGVLSVQPDGDTSKIKCPVLVTIPLGLTPDEFSNSNIATLYEDALNIIADASEGKTYRELLAS
ncbi:hypothetical protein OTK49_02125 [Vibrio coralliirubri]|uniref:hypothetical protein n=1 Tax=Vibrio coralliirubri TaxID=1516159 RepID=UPI0022839599|nr:hypothetical protein [Vibrio coralliirubri]MCY9861312.1 hypothetical protein [Vibrio coralliirubri]